MSGPSERTPEAQVGAAYQAALRAVRDASDAASGFSDLLDEMAAIRDDPLWPSLRAADIARDVARMRTFLRAQLAEERAQETTGLYLGLDTPNMDGPNGSNLEIGGSDRFHPHRPGWEWLRELTWHGDRHLIRGLREISRACARRRDEGLRMLVECPVGIGYSGLVLAEVFRDHPDAHWLGHRDHRTIVWGHHDGDLFILGNLTRERFECLASDVYPVSSPEPRTLRLFTGQAED